jgi:predicted transposase/invertase (TIGR01784 family)
MRERYVNPFTDFGFKKLFGEEANTDLLIDFINTLLPEAGPVASLTFLKTEHLGVTPTDRKAIFDLYCQNERGEKFIVELQKARQKYFKDRSLYYATFAIQEQAVTGEWDFRLQKVYAIAIMDFVFDEAAAHRDKFRHDVQLVETQTQAVFYDKLRFIYLEMPKFTKTEAELETHFDKWLYLLKNLAQLQDLPPRLQERIFEKVFNVAELAKFNAEERYAYQDSVKYYRDLKNSLDTAREEGEAVGEAKGRQAEKLEVVNAALVEGLPLNVIAKLTGLSEEEIQRIKEAAE